MPSLQNTNLTVQDTFDEAQTIVPDSLYSSEGRERTAASQNGGVFVPGGSMGWV